MTKKRLTFSQIEKKSKLLNETRINIKGHNRKEITRIWQTYRGKKFVIEELPKYRKKLSATWNKTERENLKLKYLDKKEIATAKLEYGGLKLQKKVHGSQSQQDFYKLRKGNAESVITRIFNTKNPRYLLLTLKVRNLDTGIIYFPSNSYTNEGWQRVLKSGDTAIEDMLKKAVYLEGYEYEILSIHIRIIYANPEKIVGQQKNRTNKK
jgi:hypothetical protein